MLEILAPAGNAECANAAIDNGANAIYLGFSSFSARQSAENFDEESLRKIVERAHFCGVKVYVAMNTLVKDEETETFLRSLVCVWNLGVDAIILQDIFLGKAIKERYPEIVLHLSTQAGVCSSDGAKFAKECGFSRVIVARETPLSEIQKITKILETECFVQGALCTCFSGQCYFSSFAGGNSGNRGRCKQPCRKRYAYDRQGFEETSYALSLSDLCVGENIGKYIAAGVTSFKIEGRMRRAEYVGAATRYYRLLLNDETGEKDRAVALSDLKRTYNRGNYTKGLAFGQDKRFLSTAIQGHIGEKVGVVNVRNGNYFVESTFSPRQGDAFKILRDGKELGGAVFSKKSGKGFVVLSKTRLKNGDGVFVTTDGAVNERALAEKKRVEISLRLCFCEGDFAVAEGAGVRIQSEERLQTAASRPLTEEELRVCFSKTDGLPVEIAFEDIKLQGNIFIPKSTLNAFRRAFFAKLSETVTKNGRKEIEYRPLALPTLCGENGMIAVMSNDFKGVAADIAICKPDDFTSPLPESFTSGKFEKYLYYPAFCTERDCEALAARCKETDIDGIYAENYGGMVFAKEHDLKVFAGTGFNLMNAIAVGELLKDPCVRYYAISKETNETGAAALAGKQAFALTAGDIKLMDLCYCPFGKTCNTCDKRSGYTLTDENGRVFPVRRYRGGDGNCRFEVYNCAKLVSTGVKGAGRLLDLTATDKKAETVAAVGDTQEQKTIFENYTSGHYKRGVL